MTSFPSVGLHRAKRVSRETWFKIARETKTREQNHRCYYCHSSMTYGTATGDHIVPKSRGGSHWNVGNLVAACGECNHAKASMDAAIFLRVISARVPAPGTPLPLWMAWSRRRIALAGERAVRRISVATGLAACR